METKIAYKQTRNRVVPTEQTFVDDKYFCPRPTRTSLLILPNSVSELFRYFASETNASEGMNSHTTDIASGNT